jgi:transmembrane sensor
MNKETFIKYFNGSISEEEEKNLLSWIDECEANRHEFFQERKLWDMFLLNSSSEMMVQSPTLKDKKVSKLVVNKWVIELSKIAAIFLLAFFVSFLLMKKPLSEAQAWNTIEVPIGQRTCLHLADGTTVWLNAKTKFSFPDRFKKDIREVKLDGEAIFDVSHNEKVPFIVKAQKYNVKVLGTEFNVYAYDNSNVFETTLVKGKVLLEKNDSKEKAVELHPDQIAIYNAQSKLLEIKPVDTIESLYWKEGIYSFNNQPLSSIIQRLERYYEVTINVKNPKILGSKFTGKFRYSDPIEVILEVVRKGTSFKYIKKDNEITIYK